MNNTIFVDAVRTDYRRTIRKWMRRHRISVIDAISHYGDKEPGKKTNQSVQSQIHLS